MMTAVRRDAPLLSFYLTESARAAGVRFLPPRDLDAGFDIQSAEAVTIEPGQSALVPTGLHLAIPESWVGLIRDRSSVARRGGVTAAGVIDAAYRGEVKILIYNLGTSPLAFNIGDRVAQCLVLPHFQNNRCQEVFDLAELGETERGVGGFGSTGR